ncbi:hypothetical protein [Brevibacterium samyangense]|uniref:Ankyrin repeat domain-containing protein n=1 Tax=Brevibacterium samyangense TaxID=366888 RepID=A0ABN2T508_9MICO
MPSVVFTARNGTYEEFLSVYDPATQDVTKLLFKASAHRNAVDRAKIMHRLLDDGADPSAEDEFGSTLLGVLEVEHDPAADGRLLERLIADGANVNALGRKGDRPIDLVRRMSGVKDEDRTPYYKVLFEADGLDLDLPENSRDPEGPTYRESFTDSEEKDRFPVMHRYFSEWERQHPPV